MNRKSLVKTRYHASRLGYHGNGVSRDNWQWCPLGVRAGCVSRGGSEDWQVHNTLGVCGGGGGICLQEGPHRDAIFPTFVGFPTF